MDNHIYEVYTRDNNFGQEEEWTSAPTTDKSDIPERFLQAGAISGDLKEIAVFQYDLRGNNMQTLFRKDFDFPVRINEFAEVLGNTEDAEKFLKTIIEHKINYHQESPDSVYQGMWVGTSYGKEDFSTHGYYVRSYGEFCERCATLTEIFPEFKDTIMSRIGEVSEAVEKHVTQEFNSLREPVTNHANIREFKEEIFGKRVAAIHEYALDIREKEHEHSGVER